MTSLPQAAAAAAGRQLWSNVELFEGWPAPCEYPAKCGRHPAPIDRIVKQLASEDPYVGGRHIAWEWATCLSPYTNVNTSALYRDYAEYVGANVAALLSREDINVSLIAGGGVAPAPHATTRHASRTDATLN